MSDAGKILAAGEDAAYYFDSRTEGKPSAAIAFERELAAAMESKP